MIVPFSNNYSNKHEHIQVRFNNLNAPEVFVDGVKKEIEYISYEYNRDKTVGQPRWIDIEYLDHGEVKKIYLDNSRRN
ncbi:conserved protein of unknown function [Oenococcus oeni]|uniref:hypothetical protein n=1 Tax=Oenococcus oeni TaxID=1247 RepID=UPI00107E3AED|nr:hypothetical protein [Oenococcus oeni]AVI94094.1 hypothetical protein AX764_04270 [Oenococcus oeni]SYV99710.1 conserved hypothetical protein [Oenococcus oeni]SYW03886.1 conserved hypothetical protein [Oenococcus oeni]SYW17664.1 conserved hypothetical protein [Oenococcus oeni]VDC14611.1 conserved protein of unknown function [Oenococcus oeni]